MTKIRVEIIINSKNKKKRNATALCLMSILTRQGLNVQYGFTKEEWQEIADSSFSDFSSKDTILKFAEDK